VIAASRPHGARWLLRFEGFEDSEGARRLTGGELRVPQGEAIEPPPGQYYSHDLEGFRCERPDGEVLGVVEGLERTPAGPLLSVRTLEGKSALVPFVETIVVRIDEPGRRIVLDPPVGLLDL